MKAPSTSHVALALMITALTSLSALAGSRDDDDAIFNQPPNASTPLQAIASASELAAAGTLLVWATRFTVAPEVELATDKLKTAQALPTTLHEKELLVAQIEARMKTSPSLSLKQLKASLELDLVKNYQPGTISKAATIEAAERELTLAKSVANEGRAASMAAKGLKFAGAAGFATDAAARLYVWLALDKDPGALPLVRLATHAHSHPATAPQSAVTTTRDKYLHEYCSLASGSCRPAESLGAERSDESQYLDRYDSRKLAESTASGDSKPVIQAGSSELR